VRGCWVGCIHLKLAQTQVLDNALTLMMLLLLLLLMMLLLLLPLPMLKLHK
jgi:hypothetical protein